jgi:hypothetical protein
MSFRDLWRRGGKNIGGAEKGRWLETQEKQPHSVIVSLSFP